MLVHAIVWINYSFPLVHCHQTLFVLDAEIKKHRQMADF